MEQNKINPFQTLFELEFVGLSPIECLIKILRENEKHAEKQNIQETTK